MENAAKNYGSANPSEAAMQEKHSAKQKLKHKKRIDILKNLLYKNNRCNEELALQVEIGGGYQFLDCPPLLYSPAEKSSAEKISTTQESHSKSFSKPMRGSLNDHLTNLVSSDKNSDEQRTPEMKSHLWGVLANISEN